MEGSTHRAAVFTPGNVHYGNGTHVQTRPGLHLYLNDILAGTVDRFEPQSTIVIDGTTVDQVRYDQVRGWNYSRPGPWTLFHRPDGRTVAVGIRKNMTGHHFGVLVNPDTDPGVLAMLLDRYSRLTGLSWRGTCATTALAGIRASWPHAGDQPLWSAPLGLRSIGPLVWARELTADELAWGYVHTFDANAAYLGSMGNAVLAWSQLERTGPRAFDKSMPGYWTIRLSGSTLAWNNDPRRPPLLPAQRVHDGIATVTTPYAELLGQLGDELDVVASYTPTRSRGATVGVRVLRSFAETLRDARLRVDELPLGGTRETLRTAVKRTYKDATGGMQRETMRVFRPDWAHTDIELWRATLMRRIIHVRETQGVWPVRIVTDSISYADGVLAQQPIRSMGEFETLADAVRVDQCGLTGCGCAPITIGNLGRYKHESVLTVAEWTTCLCTGRHPDNPQCRARPPYTNRRTEREPVALVERRKPPMGPRTGPDRLRDRLARLRETKRTGREVVDAGVTL